MAQGQTPHHQIININFQATTGILDVSGNPSDLSHRWEQWIKQFKFYLRASDMLEASQERKAAILLSLIGPEAVTIFNSFDADAETIKYDDLI